MDKQFPAHFSYKEMTFSETAFRLEIDNMPDEAQIDNLIATANQMETVREILGVPISVTCAFRSFHLNEVVGGSSTSSHLDGEACDFRPVGLELFAAAKKIESSDLRYDQLILEYGWIHLGFGPKMRRVSMTKKSKNEPYLVGLSK